MKGEGREAPHGDEDEVDVERDSDPDRQPSGCTVHAEPDVEPVLDPLPELPPERAGIHQHRRRAEREQPEQHDRQLHALGESLDHVPGERVGPEARHLEEQEEEAAEGEFSEALEAIGQEPGGPRGQEVQGDEEQREHPRRDVEDPFRVLHGDPDDAPHEQGGDEGSIRPQEVEPRLRVGHGGSRIFSYTPGGIKGTAPSSAVSRDGLTDPRFGSILTGGRAAHLTPEVRKFIL
jgi:hypothetical protein